MPDKKELEIESAKLDREEEQAMADESYVADIDFSESDAFYTQSSTTLRIKPNPS
jgi:hypothetical protein